MEKLDVGLVSEVAVPRVACNFYKDLELGQLGRSCVNRRIGRSRHGFDVFDENDGCPSRKRRTRPVLSYRGTFAYRISASLACRRSP